LVDVDANAGDEQRRRQQSIQDQAAPECDHVHRVFYREH
jgi:hypothetical protein